MDPTPLTPKGAQHQLSMPVYMTSALVNFHGNLDGGDLLKSLDQVAYAGAIRKAARLKAAKAKHKPTV